MSTGNKTKAGLVLNRTMDQTDVRGWSRGQVRSTGVVDQGEVQVLESSKRKKKYGEYVAVENSTRQ